MALKYVYLSILLVLVPFTGGWSISKAKKQTQKPEHHFTWFRVLPESGLNMRESPAVDSAVVRTLPQNYKGRILERTAKPEIVDNRAGYWFRVSADKKEGWIFSGYTYTGENSPDGYVEVFDESFHMFSQLPSFKDGNLGSKVSSLKTVGGEVSLFEIKGAPQQGSGYCGVAPRIAKIVNTIETKVYQYKPLQNVDGYYSTDLNDISEVLPGIIAISEFNGQCNGRTATWPRLIIFGENGTYSMVQDLNETHPFCGDGGENTMRRVLIDKKLRQIYIFEQIGECVDKGPDAANLTPYEVSNYRPPRFIVISVQKSIASRNEYTKQTLPQNLQKLFNALESRAQKTDSN